jgi:hypothetical protein
MDMRELGEARGLIVFDTAIPQSWVDVMLELTKNMAGKPIYPYGFVWCYDKSPIFGEPIPLTEYAELYAQFVNVNPR